MREKYIPNLFGLGFVLVVIILFYVVITNIELLLYLIMGFLIFLSITSIFYAGKTFGEQYLERKNIEKELKRMREKDEKYR